MEWVTIILIVILVITIAVGCVFMYYYYVRGSNSHDGICTKQSECPSGYVCMGGVCKRGVGETCSGDGVCVDGSSCVEGICSARDLDSPNNRVGVSKGSPTESKGQEKTQIHTPSTQKVALTSIPTPLSSVSPVKPIAPPPTLLTMSIKPRAGEIYIPEETSEIPSDATGNSRSIDIHSDISDTESVSSAFVDGIEGSRGTIQRSGFQRGNPIMRKEATRMAPRTILHQRGRAVEPDEESDDDQGEDEEQKETDDSLPRGRTSGFSRETDGHPSVGRESGFSRETDEDQNPDEEEGEDEDHEQPSPRGREMRPTDKEVKREVGLGGECTGKENVLDVCGYSSDIIILYKDGHIMLETEDKKRTRVTNNIHLNRVEHFGGYVYGVSCGSLYKLDGDTYKEREWIWDSCRWSPVGITHISATLGGEHLWIQTQNAGNLYNASGEVVPTEISPSRDTTTSPREISLDSFWSKNRRVYGYNKEIYMDINTDEQQAILRRGEDDRGVLIRNIYAGAINYDGQVASIRPEQKDRFRDIRIINWKAYYLLRGKDEK